MPNPGPWLVLLGAILVEVLATTLLKRSNGMSHPAFAALALLAYLLAIWLFSLVQRWLPMGIVYALWSGLGMVLVALAAWIFWGETINFWGMVGIALIALGAAVLQISSGPYEQARAPDKPPSGHSEAGAGRP